MRYPIYAAVLLLVLGQSPLARAWDALAGEIFGSWTTTITADASTYDASTDDGESNPNPTGGPGLDPNG